MEVPSYHLFPVTSSFLHYATEKFEEHECPEILRETREDVADTVCQIAVQDDLLPSLDIGEISPYEATQHHT